MRRRILSITVTFGVLVAFGLLSNVSAAGAVEQMVLERNHAALSELGLQSSRYHPVSKSAIPALVGVDPDGRKVHFSGPPDQEIPFSYASARWAGPFLLRVRYGWAAAGPRQAVGEGGELLVFSVFGRGNRILRQAPHWYY